MIQTKCIWYLVDDQRFCHVEGARDSRHVTMIMSLENKGRKKHQTEISRPCRLSCRHDCSTGTTATHLSSLVQYLVLHSFSARSRRNLYFPCNMANVKIVESGGYWKKIIYPQKGNSSTNSAHGWTIHMIFYSNFPLPSTSGHRVYARDSRHVESKSDNSERPLFL